MSRMDPMGCRSARKVLLELQFSDGPRPSHTCCWPNRTAHTRHPLCPKTRGWRPGCPLPSFWDWQAPQPHATSYAGHIRHAPAPRTAPLWCTFGHLLFDRDRPNPGRRSHGRARSPPRRRPSKPNAARVRLARPPACPSSARRHARLSSMHSGRTAALS
jgi:hypothetical protein